MVCCVLTAGQGLQAGTLGREAWRASCTPAHVDLTEWGPLSAGCSCY